MAGGAIGCLPQGEHPYYMLAASATTERRERQKGRAVRGCARRGRARQT